MAKFPELHVALLFQKEKEAVLIQVAAPEHHSNDVSFHADRQWPINAKGMGFGLSILMLSIFVVGGQRSPSMEVLRC